MRLRWLTIMALLSFFVVVACNRQVTTNGLEELSDATAHENSLNSNDSSIKELIWTAELGVHCTLSLIHDGVLYISRNAGGIVALDSSTGVEVWHIDLGECYPEIFGVTDNETLLLGSGGTLYGVDVSSGEIKSESENVLWQTSNNNVDKFRVLWTENRLYLYGTITDRPTNSYLSFITVLDLTSEDRTKLWTFTTEGRWSSSLVLTDDFAFFGTGDRGVECSSGALHCISLESGEEAYSFNFDSPALAAVLENETLYVLTAQDYMYSYFGTLHAFDFILKGKLWEQSGIFGDSHPLIIDDKVILGLSSCSASGEEEGGVVALSQESGTREWYIPLTNEGKSPTWFVADSSAIYFGETYIEMSHSLDSGFVYAIDYDGNEIWKYQTDGAVFDLLLSEEGKLFASCENGFLYAFE